MKGLQSQSYSNNFLLQSLVIGPFVRSIPEVVAPNTLTEMARRESSSNSTPQRSTSGGDDSESDLDEENNRPRGIIGCGIDVCVLLLKYV